MAPPRDSDVWPRSLCGLKIHSSVLKIHSQVDLTHGGCRHSLVCRNPQVPLCRRWKKPGVVHANACETSASY